MTTATSSPTPGVSTPQTDTMPTLLEWLSAVARTLEKAGKDARAYRTLARLDDRTLKDIGLHRTEISSVLHHEDRDPSRRSR